MSTSEAMIDDLRTDLCELGFMELVDYVHEFLPKTAANMIAIKQLNRMWRFIAMMAAHWEGAIFCKRECGRHMLLNPTKLQKPNAEKDAWCCDAVTCRDFCSSNIPKCLKNDDELREQRIGGYPAFEFLAIDFGVCHESEVSYEVREVLTERQPTIDNVYFDSWPQDDVVAIRFMHWCCTNNDKEINNKLLERFGPRNLRLFVAANAPISPTSLGKCGKLKWLDLFNTRQHADEETMCAVVKLPQLKRLSLDWCSEIPKESLNLLRDNTSIENLSLSGIANDAIVEEVCHMKYLVSLNLNDSGVSSSAIASLVTNATRLGSLTVLGCSNITSADISNIANISSLRSLNVLNWVVTNSNAEELTTKLPQLEVLKLACYNLHNCDVFAGLGTLRALLSLTLWNVPGDVSPDAFNAAIGNLTQLQVLELCECCVKSEHLLFLEKLRNLEVFSFEMCENVDDECLSHLRFLSNLRKLNLSSCRGITSDGFAHLSQLTEMESLNLSGTNIDDKALQHIGGLTKMRWLNLRRCENITDKGLLFLRDMRELECFILIDCEDVTATGIIRCVEKMNKLTFVCHSCGEEGTEAINKSYPQVLVVEQVVEELED